MTQEFFFIQGRNGRNGQSIMTEIPSSSCYNDPTCTVLWSSHYNSAMSCWEPRIFSQKPITLKEMARAYWQYKCDHLYIITIEPIKFYWIFIINLRGASKFFSKLGKLSLYDVHITHIRIFMVPKANNWSKNNLKHQFYFCFFM